MIIQNLTFLTAWVGENEKVPVGEKGKRPGPCHLQVFVRDLMHRTLVCRVSGNITVDGLRCVRSSDLHFVFNGRLPDHGRLCAAGVHDPAHIDMNGRRGGPLRGSFLFCDSWTLPQECQCQAGLKVQQKVM